MLKQNNKIFTLPIGDYGIGVDGTIYRDLCPEDLEGGVNYPAGTGPLFTPEGRAELGITEEPAPVRPDERLFFVSQNENGSYNQTPRPVEQVTGPVWERIKAERDRRTQTGGYKVTVNGVDKWFHSDSQSRIQQLGLLLMGANIPSGLQWKVMDGSFATMTPTIAGAIFAAAAASDHAIFAAAEAHKAAMEAAVNPVEYDFLTGWPLIYSEV